MQPYVIPSTVIEITSKHHIFILIINGIASHYQEVTLQCYAIILIIIEVTSQCYIVTFILNEISLQCYDACLTIS